MADDTSRIPVLVVNDTRVDNHHGCFSVMTAITQLLDANGMVPVAFWPAHAEWRGNAEFDGALGRAALVIVNGEGTIHHDLPAGRRLLEVAAAVRAVGKPVALINTGWEANGPELTDMLQDFDLIAVRDTRSAGFIDKASDKVRVVPDLSFYYAGTTAQTLCDPDPGDRSGIGFTDNVDRKKALYLEQLRQAVKGQTLSIVHGDKGGYLQFLRDGLSLRQDIIKPRFALGLLGLRHRLWAARHLDTPAFLTQLAKLQLAVSGRFHTCTLAVAVGTPFVAQSSNTGKIAALAHDAGLAEWRTSGDLNPNDIAEAAKQGWSTAEIENRTAYLGVAKTKAETLFLDLRGLAV